MPKTSMRGMRAMPKVSGKDMLKTIKRLLQYVFKYYKFRFLVVIVCVLITSLTGVLGSKFVGSVLIDNFINPALKNGLELNQVKWELLGFSVNFTGAIIIMAVIYVLTVGCNYLYNFFMSGIGQGVQKILRDELYEHLQTLPIAYFDRRNHGDIMSIFTNDIDALREMLGRALPMAATSLLTIVSCFFMMITTDLMLTAFVFAFAFLMFFITKFLTKRSSKYFIAQQIELGKTNGYIEEMITGQKVIKVFNYEERNIEGFKEHNNQFFNNSVKANRYAAILMPTVNQLGNLQYALLGLVGGLFVALDLKGVAIWNVHSFTTGLIVSFLLYSKSFIQPIGQISQQLNIIALALAGGTRIFEVIDTPSEIDNGYVQLVNVDEVNGEIVESFEKTGKWAWKHPHTDGSKTTYTWLKGEITMDEVDFGYLDGKIVLHDVTLYAKPGQKVAFVGPTGAGKTTITNLINRFYDIEDGKVRYDGININKIKKADLRKSLGMVLQDTKLFTASVKENILYGNPDATDEEIVSAAKLANAHDFISKLPQGYDTILTNGGAALSQGQRQLISIARCAVANPPVMILDEATSSIDTRTELLVQQGMDAIMKGRTVFVIAHRLSTIQNADVIMVLVDGRIIERGNHEQLLAQKGKYYQLYTGKTA